MPKGVTKIHPGDRFGELTLKTFLGCLNGIARWEVVCSCGNTKVVCASNLVREKRGTRTCGDRSKHPYAHTIHGMGKTREYAAWKRMLQRCRDTKTWAAEYYAGRGISVCEQWRESFVAFFQHIGPMPDGYRIGVDRINHDGNYEPGNVRWATPSENNHNRRPKRWFRRPVVTA